MATSRPDTSNWVERHPLLSALFITAVVGLSVRFPWWSSWHHWWDYPERLGHLLRTAWDHPPAK